MSFAEDYEELEARFKNQVKKDNDTWKSIYLRTSTIPEEKVDYVLIGMEPSLGRWTKGKDTLEERLKIAQDKIDKGFRNFALTIEDFIVHHCIKEYLCSKSETYYITDLSKGAMLTEKAEIGRGKRYHCWYRLLVDEIELVLKTKGKVIAIGCSVYEFLMKQKFGKETARELYCVPHYSNNASWYWDRLLSHTAPQRNKPYASIDIAKVIEVAVDILDQSKMTPDLKKKILGSLPAHLSDSKMKLILTYKTCFEQIRYRPELNVTMPRWKLTSPA